jgi:YD repeat-containing protein
MYARRFPATGAAGSEIKVTDTSVTANHPWSSPGVAADALGDFLVHWTTYDTTSGNYNVLARRYRLRSAGLSAATGRIASHRYYDVTTTTDAATPGAVTGYLAFDGVQGGELGVAAGQGSTLYSTHLDANGTTVYPVASRTVYRNADGTGAETTTYTYSDWNGSRPGHVTTTQPRINANQNGPGSDDVSETVYDTYGRPIWTKDADGFLNYMAYDPATGALIKSITDVDTTKTGDFTNLPTGWSTPTGTPAPPVARFDFGSSTSPVASGFARATGSDLYTAAAGDGWTTAVNSLDRGWTSDPLYRDFVWGPDGTFSVDLPKGNYDVTVWIADAFAHDLVGIYLEGNLAATVSTAANQLFTNTYRVFVGDGQLTLRMLDLGGSDPNFVLNGLSIAPAAAGLHLVTSSAVDDQGRPISVADPGGRTTTTTYYDTAHAVVTAPGGTAPMTVSREDHERHYTETYTVPAGTQFTVSGEDLIPKTAGGGDVVPLSMTRTFVNAAGQTVAEDTYFSFAGLTAYSSAATFGSRWFAALPTSGNYYRTSYSYDNAGRLNRTVAPTGTVTRTVYDSQGRVAQTWVGTEINFGWQTTGVLSADSFQGTDLTRDFNEKFDGDGTFAVDLPDGNYNVTVTEGEPNRNHFVNITLNGVASGPVGGFGIRSITLPVTVTGSHLEVGLHNSGTDYPYWVIEGLVIAPPPGTSGVTLNFDFGTATSPVAAGYIQVTGYDLYNNGPTWSPSAPGNFVEVAAYEYDNNGAGDGNLTKMTEFPGGGAAPRVTQYFYDARDRLVATKTGATDTPATEDTNVNRPITYTEYDNLGDVIAEEQYDGDGVTISDGNGDGVPDKPAANLLRARTTTEYDDQGRTFRTTVYSVDPTNGTISAAGLHSDTWYDHRGNVAKTAAPGGVVTKTTYDGAGRPTVSYTTDGRLDTSWADALSVADDTVLEQVETQYDGTGNVIRTATRQRFHDATGTGPLGDPLTAPLDDSGFEVPVQSPGGFTYAPTGSAWSFGPFAGVAANGSGFTVNNPPAPEGTQVAFLQGANASIS